MLWVVEWTGGGVVGNVVRVMERLCERCEGLWKEVLMVVEGGVNGCDRRC